MTLQMDDFLPLGGISGLFKLNESERTGFLLHFIVKNIFFGLMNIIGDIPCRKLAIFEGKLLSWSAMVFRYLNGYL